MPTVTFFFNGGREAPFEGEDRILVPSPKVATYDLKPEMSAFEVKDKLVEAIRTNKYDFIVVNFANGDMVGHTGVYEAIEKAVIAIDQCVNEVVTAANETDYETIIIADHGNADNAINPDGTPNTAHSLNPVPFIYVTANKGAKVKNGVLADVAPSILHILGLPQPKEMTGHELDRRLSNFFFIILMPPRLPILFGRARSFLHLDYQPAYFAPRKRHRAARTTPHDFRLSPDV